MLNQKAPSNGHRDHRFLILDPSIPELFFRSSDHGNFGMGVNNGGHRVITNPVLPSEHVVYGNDSFAGGGVSEHAPSGYVATCPNSWNVRLSLL